MPNCCGSVRNISSLISSGTVPPNFPKEQREDLENLLQARTSAFSWLSLVLAHFFIKAIGNFEGKENEIPQLIQALEALDTHLSNHYPRRLILPSLLVFLLLWAALYTILIKFTNSTVPVLDSFGNALSFIGLWALAKKYIEQWCIWIVVDIELAGLYVYKEIPFTAGLYAFYAVIAVAGYFKWKKDLP